MHELSTALIGPCSGCGTIQFRCVLLTRLLQVSYLHLATQLQGMKHEMVCLQLAKPFAKLFAKHNTFLRDL